MNKNIISSLKSVWKSIHGPMISYIVGAGLGAYLLNKFYNFVGLVKSLLNSTTTLGVLLVVGSLFLLLGYLRGKPKQNKRPQIINDSLVQIGPYKWQVKLYADRTFFIDFSPYCSQHELKLVENWPLYLCPLHNECGCQIPERNIKFAYQQAESLIEGNLRNQNLT